MAIPTTARVVLASFNTAVERLLIGSDFAVGEVNTLDCDHTLAGGKGVNTARVLRQLDALVPQRVPVGLLCGFLGGATGELVREGLAAEGLVGEWVDPGVPTRISEVLVDPENPSRATVFNARGADVAADRIAALDARFTEIVDSTVGVVCSGSLPPGVAPDAYARWITRSHTHGRWSLVDARGPVLRAAVAASPTIVKVNRNEIAEISSDTETLVREWIDAGTTAVIITDGAAATSVHLIDQTAHITPPQVEAISGVGSGDAFTAGLVAGLTADDHTTPGSTVREVPAWDTTFWDNALRLAAACGAANATGIRAGLPHDLTSDHLTTLASLVQITWTAN